MNLEYKQAIAIINLAKSHNHEIEVPSSEADTIKVAKDIVSQAQKASEKGNKSAAVTEILFAANLPEKNIESPKTTPDEAIYADAISTKIADLPVPPEIEGPVPDIPMDLTELSDKQLMKLHSMSNACSARANFLYAIEEAGEAAAKHIGNHLYEEFLIRVEKVDPDSKKPKTLAVLKAEASNENPILAEWRKKEYQHSIKANKYKRVLEIHDNYCDRLSRAWSLRVEERQHS